jgi:hypothetical protein
MKASGPGNANLYIREYPVGTLTDTIYDGKFKNIFFINFQNQIEIVPGTFEDWAYAASWEGKATNN